MEDFLRYPISSHIKHRQNQKTFPTRTLILKQDIEDFRQKPCHR